MTKKEFIQHYAIADAKPLDPSKKAIPAEAFSYALAEFMENRFASVVRVSFDNISAQSVLICAEYVAEFFKMLIIQVYGRAEININISTDKERLTLIVGVDGGLPVSDSELRQLIRLARNGGFQVNLHEGAMVLSVDFTPTVSHRVYAVSIVDGRRVMLGKLVEVFCHGELFNPDPPPLPPMPEPIKKMPKKRKTTKATNGNE